VPQAPVIARSASTGTRAGSWGRIIVAGEVALGLTLTVAGALVVGSLTRIWRTDVGFETARVSALQLRLTSAPSAALADEVRELTAAVRRLPGVAGVAATDAPLFAHGGQRMAVHLPPGADPEATVLQQPVTPEYFEALALRLVSGRWPDAGEFERGGAIVVSESAANAYWPGRDPIGQTLEAERGGTFTVAGMVGDVRYLAWDFPPAAAIYVPYSTFARSRTPTLLVRTASVSAPIWTDVLRLVHERRSSIRGVRVRSVDELLGDNVRAYRFDSWLFGGFAGAALLLVGVGTFGLLAMTTGGRVHEMGVRRALGATPGRVVRLLLAEHAAAMAAGLCAGGLISVWTVRLLQRDLYELTIYDPGVWTIAAVTVVATAAAGTLLPAVRASRVSVLDALRVD
jgi:hypothetical protein